MKTENMLPRVLTGLGFAAVLALSPAAGQAQTNGATPPKQEDSRRHSVDTGDGGFNPQSPVAVRYDLEIENNRLMTPGPHNPAGNGPANLDNIIKLLREKHPNNNIAMDPALANVMVADLKLHASPLDEELEALRVASGGKFTWKGSHNDLFFTLEPSEQFAQGTAPPGRPQIEVFNFSSYLAQRRNSQSMNDEQFLQFKYAEIGGTQEIIKQTLQSFNGNGNALHFQFHDGANLLVVGGTNEEDMEVAKKIINAMIEQPSGDANFSPVERRFTVLGEVQHPGSFDFPQNGSENLLEAIATAGGYTRLGAPINVKVRRTEKDGSSKIYNLDADKMSKDPTTTPFEILPGDNINVGQRNF